MTKGPPAVVAAGALKSQFMSGMGVPAVQPKKAICRDPAPRYAAETRQWEPAAHFAEREPMAKVLSRRRCRRACGPDQNHDDDGCQEMTPERAGRSEPNRAELKRQTDRSETSPPNDVYTCLQVTNAGAAPPSPLGRLAY
jgi:hypothetical protein